MINRTRSVVHLLAASFIALLLASCGGDDIGSTKDSAQTQAFYPPASEEWVLIWSDEFEGETLDTSKWGFDLGDGSDRGLTRWGNNEQQWYTEDNVTVSDGTLKITAIAEEVEAGFPYTSSRINTKEKLDIKYGRIEARVKAPAGQGLWAAFWMLPTDSPYGSDGWAASGEIDIMEAVNSGTDNAVLAANLHHGFPWPLNQQLPTDIDGAADTDFNIYAVEWEQNEIRWYFNDVHFKTMTSESYYTYYYDEVDQVYKLGPDGAPFDTEFHILLNMAVGGNLAGDVDNAILPGAMEVDYVRVYECAYGLEDGSGCNSNADRTLEAADALRPGTSSYDLYVDAPGAFRWEIAGEEIVRELGASVLWDNGGAITLTEVAAADAERGMVLDVSTTGSGNIGLYATDGQRIELVGMGNNPNFWELAAGEIRFDLYIDSANTDQESIFAVKMDSGYPAVGAVELAVADLPQDQWTTISVKINDLLSYRRDWLQPLDTASVLNLFVFEPTGAAHVMIDNISLSCGSPGTCNVKAPVEEGDISGPFQFPGTWVITPEAGALGVGPSAGDISWWANSEGDLTARACLFDDEYVFGADGSFQNVLGDDTWIETWQSGSGEACAAPVAPHDGSGNYTFSYDEVAGTLTLEGVGAHMGLAKATNGAELATPGAAPASVTYEVTVVDNANITLGIDVGTGYWTFRFTKTADAPQPPSVAGTWQVAPEAGSLGVGPAQGDISWWAIDDGGVTARACFFDDEFVFGSDGSFANVLQDETWVEAWQSGAGDACGPPVNPHDGTGDFTYTYDSAAGTLTLDGVGAYLGIPKATNGAEIGSPNDAPANVTYIIDLVDANTMILDIDSGTAWWRFKLIKTAEPSPVEGTWMVASEAGSLGVGPTQGDISWWAIDDGGLTARACYFDDQYVFGADGSFSNVLQDETWVEAWQSGAGEACAAPVSPHDGTGNFTYSYDSAASTLTVQGVGAYVGLPKATNGAEIASTNEAPAEITYLVDMPDANTMILDIDVSTGWWRYKLVKQ